MLALLRTIFRRKIRLQAAHHCNRECGKPRDKTALDRFWSIPYLSASRRSERRGDQLFPGILAVHKTNSYAVSTRGWVCIRNRLAALGQIDSADQRSGFGSKDAADRFDTFGGARCNVNQLMRRHTRASRTARSAILFPTARASSPLARAAIAYRIVQSLPETVGVLCPPGTWPFREPFLRRRKKPRRHGAAARK